MATFERIVPSSPPEPSPEAAQAEIARIMGDPSDLYHAAHSGKAGHDARVEEVAGFFRAAHPEPSGTAEADAPASTESAKDLVEIPLPPLPEGMERDPHVLQEFEALANDLDLPPETAVKVLELEAQCWQQEPPSAEESLAQLRERWGGETEKKIAAARWLVETFISAPLQAVLERSGLGNHPELVILAADEAERRQTLLRQEPQLRAEIARHIPGNPSHVAAVAKRDNLYTQVYGRRRVG